MPSVGHRVAALAALAVVLAGVLSGCVGSDPKPTTTPKPSATPLYSSDAKALAAAKEAYARYVDVSNEIAHAGWVDLSPLETVTTGDALRADRKAGESNRSQGLHVEGDVTGSVIRLQNLSAKSVVTYSCLDLRGTKVVDESGADQTSPNRTEIIPFEVRFVPDRDVLVVGRLDIWSGDSFC